MASHSEMSSLSSSLSYSGESLLELLTGNLEADCGSIWRLQLQAADDVSQISVPVPFLFPNEEDRAAAAANSQLASAILTIQDKGDRIRTVKYLLTGQSPQALNRRDTRGRTPLMYAVARDDTPVIKMLLSCPDVDLTARDRFGNTTLMYASGHGHRKAVKMILDEVRARFSDRTWPEDMLAFLYAENYDDETAFTLAFARGHDDCIRVLSDYFKEAVYEDERRKCSLLYRLGVRGAAVARAFTNLQTRSTTFKWRPFLSKKQHSSDTHQYDTDHGISIKRRAQSQENVCRKRGLLPKTGAVTLRD